MQATSCKGTMLVQPETQSSVMSAISLSLCDMYILIVLQHCQLRYTIVMLLTAIMRNISREVMAPRMGSD